MNYTYDHPPDVKAFLDEIELVYDERFEVEPLTEYTIYALRTAATATCCGVRRIA